MSDRPRSKAGSKDTSASSLSFEQALARLEEIVSKLESQELPLEESLASFEEGKKLLNLCCARLEKAEARIRILLEGPDGKETLQPFEVSEGARSDG